jgi:hypothetical protein
MKKVLYIEQFNIKAMDKLSKLPVKCVQKEEINLKNTKLIYQKVNLFTLLV